MESLSLGTAAIASRAIRVDAGRVVATDLAPRPAPISPLLMVRFPTDAAADHRLGGLAAIARWTARARDAGMTLGIEAAPAGGWTQATRDDFARIGAEPVVVGRAPAGLPVLDGRYLPDAAALLDAARGAPVAPAALTDLSDEATALRRIVQATAKTSDGIVSRWLNRPISQRISAFLLRHVPEVRPSHVTAFVALVGVTMIASLLLGGAKGLILGGVLFHVASVLDGVDGELARASQRGTPEGAALDTRVDMLTNVGYFVGIAVALTRLYGGRQAAVGGLAVLFALTGLVTTAWLIKRLDRPGSFDVVKLYYRDRYRGGWQRLVTETLVLMTSRDFFAFAFGVVILCGFGWAVSWLLLGFTATYVYYVLAAVPGVLRQAEPPLTGI